MHFHNSWFIFSWCNTLPKTRNNKRYNLFCFDVDNYVKFNKLYLNINDNLQSESDMARKFYVLSLEIYKIINLPDEKRGINSIDFLNSKYNQYIKLYEESNLL